MLSGPAWHSPGQAALNPWGEQQMKRHAGFTLIELMIVVLVVAILVGVAVPAYNDQVRKTRRGAGKAVIMETVQALERFHTVNNTYVGFTPTTITSPSGSTGTARHYELTVNNLGVATYTISAVPQNAQVSDTCATLTVTHTGARTPTTEGCW